MTIWIPGIHFEVDEEARGVTDPGVGCTDWLAPFGHSNEALVFAMITDPEPNKVIAILNCQGTNCLIHSC